MNPKYRLQSLTQQHDAHLPRQVANDIATPSLSIMHFNFQHPVFRTPGARFILWGPSRRPTFRVAVGTLDGLIEIDSLRREFQIASGSHDDQLIELAIGGLRFVPDIKPGDAIPSEVLTGEASWSVTEKHKNIAQSRLQVQLLSWVSGKEVLLTDPHEIEMFLDQIENRTKLREAFRNAAIALGHGADNAEPVIRQIELLARELCYIEALRDRFSLAAKIGNRLSHMTKSYATDRKAMAELKRVQELHRTGVDEFTDILREADAQTGEILSALKTVERQVAYIRKSRDTLYALLLQWEPQITASADLRPHRTPETDKALAELYRFLAPRFACGRSMLKTRRPEPAMTERLVR